MLNINGIIREFHTLGGVMKTSELRTLGISSRQIKKLLENDVIRNVKRGYYELVNEVYPDEIVITRLFPKTVIFLESALMHYGYTDRVPRAWQIAVDRDSEKSQYEIEYPKIEPFYIERKFLPVGKTSYILSDMEISIYDRDRTICDVLRYENRLEKEVFRNAVQRYIQDPHKNIMHLFEYADIFNIKNKVQTYIGVWL